MTSNHSAQNESNPVGPHRDDLAPLIPRHYHPLWYFGAANLVALAAIGLALSNLQPMQNGEWCIIPFAFLVANLVEHRVHRGPMHHLRPPWNILFERHTRQHHVYFDHAHMSVRGPREYYWVFFPWWAIGLVIATSILFALPVAWILSVNAALVFFAVSIAYYLTYEWLHFSHHLPPESRIGRIGVLVKLRQLHTTHHDPSLMVRCNFNITFPVGDWLFGTLFRNNGDEINRSDNIRAGD